MVGSADDLRLTPRRSPRLASMAQKAPEIPPKLSKSTSREALGSRARTLGKQLTAANNAEADMLAELEEKSQRVAELEDKLDQSNTDKALLQEQVNELHDEILARENYYKGVCADNAIVSPLKNRVVKSKPSKKVLSLEEREIGWLVVTIEKIEKIEKMAADLVGRWVSEEISFEEFDALVEEFTRM